jgi:hypothetical protein
MPLIRSELLIALVAMALQHSRHQMLLGILAPMLLASPIASAIGAESAGEEWRRLARIALPATVPAVMASGVFGLMMPIEQTEGATAPISALSAVPPGLRSKPVLNDYAFGGFLIFEHVRPFIDARVEVYGDGMMSLYDKLRSADREAVEDALRRYDVPWTLSAPDNRIVAPLDREPGWRRLYVDATAVVHMRDTAIRPKGPGGRLTPRERRSKENSGPRRYSRYGARVLPGSFRTPSGQSAARDKLLLQIDARDKVDRRHAQRFGSVHVGGRVVDEQEFGRPAPGALKQDFIDARVRLDEADMTRNDAVVEFAQEIVLALGKHEGFVSEIAERVDRLAGRAQSAQQRDIFLDRFAKRLNPALVEHAYFLGEFRKAFGPRGDRSSEVLGDVRVRNKVHPKRS